MKNTNTIAFSIDQERLAYHSKNKRRKIIRLLVCLIIWGIIAIYLATPLSTYKMMHVKGNVYLKEEEILDLLDIKSTWWWLVDSEKVKTILEEHPNIDNVSISKGTKGLNISILEIYPLAIINETYLMNDGDILKIEEYPLSIDKIINISELTTESLSVFSNEYIHVDLAIRELFSRATMLDDKTIVMEGKFDESSHFKIFLNLDCLRIKLSSNNFLKIKSEILGKINEHNVQYSQENPCIVEYNFKDIYEYKVG